MYYSARPSVDGEEECLMLSEDLDAATAGYRVGYDEAFANVFARTYTTV